MPLFVKSLQYRLSLFSGNMNLPSWLSYRPILVFVYFLLMSKLGLKGQVHCFSIKVVMNKTVFVVFEKNAKIAPLIPKNDVTEPKARLL